jgi:hypothetical protein
LWLHCCHFHPITRNQSPDLTSHNLCSWCSIMNQLMRIGDSSVSIATGCRLDGLGTIPGKERFFHSVQTGSGAHPTSYPMGTGGGRFPWR